MALQDTTAQVAGPWHMGRLAGPSPLRPCDCQSWGVSPLLYATRSWDCGSWVSTQKSAFASNSLPGSNFLQDPACLSFLLLAVCNT